MASLPQLARLVFPLIFASSLVFADTLILPNGESITGTVLQEEGGVVEFKTIYLGTVKAKTSEVKVVRDIIPIANDIAAPIPPANEAHEANTPPLANTITTKDVPVAEQKTSPIWTRWKKPDNWSGKATIGIAEKRGEKDTSDINLAAELEIKQKKTNKKFAAYYNYGEQNGSKNTDDYGASFRYRYSLTDRTFIQAMSIYSHDGIKEIKHKATQSIGYGYALIKNDTMVLNIVPGIAAQYLDEQANGSSTTFMLNPYQDFTWFISERFKLTESFDSFIGTDNTNNYNFVFKTSLITVIEEPYILELRYEMDYDNKVAPGIKKNESKFIAALGYAF
jgi:putative salt-induced outer membrane protein